MLVDVAKDDIIRLADTLLPDPSVKGTKGCFALPGYAVLFSDLDMGHPGSGMGFQQGDGAVVGTVVIDEIFTDERVVMTEKKRDMALLIPAEGVQMNRQERQI